MLGEEGEGVWGEEEGVWGEEEGVWGEEEGVRVCEGCVG